MCKQISWIMITKWKKIFSFRPQSGLQIRGAWTPQAHPLGSTTMLNGSDNKGKTLTESMAKRPKNGYNSFTNHWALSLLCHPLVARNPNLQVVITHTSHVGSQHSFEIPLRMNGMYRTQFDHKGLDLLSLVIWSRLFWLSVMWSLHKAQWWSKSILTFDHRRQHSLNFGYYWFNTIFSVVV